MDSSLPSFTLGVLAVFSNCATLPTCRNIQLLCLSFIVCNGRKTINNLIRIASHRLHLDPSSFSRVLSLRKIDTSAIAKALVGYIVNYVLKEGKITIVADDTFMRRYGKKVFGRCRHRDAIRSSKKLSANDWGHRWVVVSIIIKLDWLSKPFALPVMIGLYRSPGWNFRNKRKHRTPSEIAKIFLFKIRKWFPEISILYIGDKGFGPFHMAKFCTTYGITIISRFHPDAVLVNPEKKGVSNGGRPLKFGSKLPKPSETVSAQNPSKNLKVNWYGNKGKWLHTCRGIGDWKRRSDTISVKWLYSHDEETSREDYFYTNQPDLTKKEILEGFINRWPIETTFEECKQHLKIQGMKGYCEKTVLTAVPAAFIMYSAIFLLFLALPKNKHRTVILWKGKSTISFTDMLTVVRRELWIQWIIGQTFHRKAFEKLPVKLRESLIYGLAPCD